MQNPSRHDHQRSLPLLLHASGEQPFSLLHTNEPGDPSHPRPFRPSHHPPAADPDGLKPISPSDGQQCPNPSRCRLRLRPAPSASSPMQANRSVASSSRTQHAALRSVFIQSIARASSHRLPFFPKFQQLPYASTASHLQHASRRRLHHQPLPLQKPIFPIIRSPMPASSFHKPSRPSRGPLSLPPSPTSRTATIPRAQHHPMLHHAQQPTSTASNPRADKIKCIH